MIQTTAARAKFQTKTDFLPGFILTRLILVQLPCNPPLLQDNERCVDSSMNPCFPFLAAINHQSSAANNYATVTPNLFPQSISTTKPHISSLDYAKLSCLSTHMSSNSAKLTKCMGRWRPS